MRVVTVRMSLDGHLLQRRVRVLLMRNTELVVADDFVVGDFLPLGAADEVLGLEGWVAEDVRVRGHFDELVRWHFFPDLVEEGAVVDAEGWGDALGEALPVFAVVAVGPFENGGHAALHLWEGC